MVDGLFVGVDWARNGTFTDAGDDVTARVRDAVAATYGRDQATALSPIVSGRADFDLDNRSRDYSPRNASSPLTGKVKPARPCLVQRTVGGTVYTVFRGHFDDSPISPDPNSKRAHVSLVDSLADFRGINVTTQLYSGIRTGAAVGFVLDALGWTGGRDLDPGATTIPYFWANGDDAFNLLQSVVASEGPSALLTVDDTGAIVFRDRHHRLIRSASTTSQATFRASGTVEPVMATGFTYSEAWSNVVNTIEFQNDQRALSSTRVNVWSTDEVINIGASSSYVVVVNASDPFTGALAPVAVTDYTLASGSITSATLSRTSGQSTSITLTAGGGGASIVGLALRAYSVSVIRSRRITATDTTSQTDYGQRSLPSDLEPTWANVYDAQAIADLYKLTRAQPLPQVQARFIAQHTQTARLAHMLVRDLSDRVTVVEPETSLNDPFYVESISHAAAGITQHEVTFGLELVSVPTGSPFIVGTSTLNGSDVLGY